MIEVTLEVVITLNGPIISGTATAGGYGFDSPFAKNVENNYYFPRTHIKGRLREALITLGPYIKNHNIDLLFGTESKDKTGDAPLRGSMIFSDFTNERTPAQKTRTRIRMNSERGAVDEGAYQVIESPFDTGEA
ncbi:MAG: hypothetical protein U9P10_13830, partial [Thermodesulfobacteriota bacterium]|nr:hypothetical protein [Thermodesulfobacteriota bacterium]